MQKWHSATTTRQSYTLTSIPYWSPDIWLCLDLLGDIQFGLPAILNNPLATSYQSVVMAGSGRWNPKISKQLTAEVFLLISWNRIKWQWLKCYWKQVPSTSMQTNYENFLFWKLFLWPCSHVTQILYTLVNRRNWLRSAYCLLSACFFPGFAPG